MVYKTRYERAMRQDYPKDFISDEEWDFIDSMAAAKGDGVKNKSIMACRMPKSGGDKIMAERQAQEQPVHTVEEKCAYYSKRVNDPKLSDGERRWAQMRLGQLCGGGKNQPQKKQTSAPQLPNSQRTDAQKYAYGAGIGYGSAKQGRRVDVRPENKESFRAGLDRAKRK